MYVYLMANIIISNLSMNMFNKKKRSYLNQLAACVIRSPAVSLTPCTNTIGWFWIVSLAFHLPPKLPPCPRSTLQPTKWVRRITLRLRQYQFYIAALQENVRHKRIAEDAKIFEFYGKLLCNLHGNAVCVWCIRRILDYLSSWSLICGP